MEFLIEFESLVWIKMHVWMHKILFFILFEERIYECMKLCEFFEWKCMFECMKFHFLFFLKSAFMNAWNFMNFLNENACLNALLLFVFLILFFFLRMHLWMREILWIFWMLECMSSFCLFDIVLFFLFLRMHLWMREILWIFWMKMHAWIH